MTEHLGKTDITGLDKTSLGKQGGSVEPVSLGQGPCWAFWLLPRESPLLSSYSMPIPYVPRGAGAVPAPCCLFIKKPLSFPCHLIMQSGHKDSFSLTKEAYLYDERALRPHKIESSLKALLESKPHLFRDARSPTHLSPSSLAHF